VVIAAFCLLAGGVFLLPIVRSGPGTSNFETGWLVLHTVALGALAWVMPSPWLALGFAWLAVLPWWVVGGALAGVVPAAATLPAQLFQGLFCALAGVGLLAVRAAWTPTAWDRLAVVWIAWCLASVALAEVQHHRPAVYALLGRLGLGIRPGYPPPGLFGNPPMAAWGYGWAVLSAVALGGWWWAAVVPLSLGVARTRNHAAVAATVPVLVWMVCARVPDIAWAVPSAAGAAAVITGHLCWDRLRTPVGCRWTVLRVLGRFVREMRGWGAGLGAWAERGIFWGPGPTIDNAQHWSTAHNEWAQALYEGGPVLVVAAVGVVFQGLLAPAPLLAHAALAYTALYALVYDPCHHIGQAALAVLAVGGCA
jgi:hypothetical protein